MINCDVSDHDGVPVTVREATAPISAKGEQKLRYMEQTHAKYIQNKRPNRIRNNDES
jgi:hypothetical protein